MSCHPDHDAEAASESYSISESAIALHEIYVSLRTAGFEKDEALFLVAQAMTNKSD